MAAGGWYPLEASAGAGLGLTKLAGSQWHFGEINGLTLARQFIRLRKGTN